MTYASRISGLESSLAIKAPVIVATTANITLSGEQTIDGVSVVSGDRVLVKDQTDATENGIWIVGTAAWARALDFNGPRDVVQGTVVLVVSGDASASLIYKQTAAAPEIGVSSLAFSVATISPVNSYMAAFLLLESSAAVRTALSVYDTGNVYNKTETYTQAEVDALVPVSVPIVRIEQVAISSNTEIDIDLPAGYQKFMLVLNSVRRSPSGTHGALVYRASADGGSTFTSTSSYFGGDSPVSTSTTATYGTLAPAATSGTTYYVDGHIDIYATSQGLSVMSRLSAKSSASTYDTYSKDWVNNSATGVDAIRLLLDNGNAMVSGTITLYGYI